MGIGHRINQAIFVASLLATGITLWSLFRFLFPTIEPLPDLNATAALVLASSSDSWMNPSRQALFFDLCLLLAFVLTHSFLLPVLVYLLSSRQQQQQQPTTSRQQHPPLTRAIYGLISCILLLIIIERWQPTPLAYLWSAPSWLELPVQWWYCCSWVFLFTQFYFFDQLKLVDAHRLFSSVPTSSSNILNYSAHPFLIAPVMITGCRLLLSFTADKLLFATVIISYLLTTSNFTDAETIACQEMLLGRVSLLQQADWYRRYFAQR